MAQPIPPHDHDVLSDFAGALEAAHPDLASLAGQVQRLSGEVERLRGLLRQHGIEPEDNTA